GFAGADPRDRAIAGGIVRQEQWLDVRGDEETLVGFVGDAQGSKAIRDRVLASGSDQVLLAEFDRRVGNAVFVLEPIKTAHHILIPPRPLLEIQNAVMQDNNAFAALDIITQVLLPV